MFFLPVVFIFSNFPPVDGGMQWAEEGGDFEEWF